MFFLNLLLVWILNLKSEDQKRCAAAGGWEATILALLLWDKFVGKLRGLLGMEKGAIFILRK